MLIYAFLSLRGLVLVFNFYSKKYILLFEGQTHD